MKRFLILILLCLWVLPVAGQDLDARYEFETGTVIDYPSDWTDEEADQLLILAAPNSSQIIVLDYPVVNIFLTENPEFSASDAVESITNELLGDEIDPTEIYSFELDGREVTAYDIELAVSGNVYAIEFSNGALGILVLVAIEEDLGLDILASFDNTEEVQNDVAIPSNSVTRNVPGAYIFQADGRFILPANWGIEARLLDEIEYAVLSAPDGDNATVMLFDLSNTLTSGTDLDVVLDELDIDWDDDFSFEIDNSADAYAFGDREAIRYELSVDGQDGSLIILRFTNNAIGLVAIYGDDTDNYAQDINQLVGSFNNLGSLLEFIN